MYVRQRQERRKSDEGKKMKHEMMMMMIVCKIALFSAYFHCAKIRNFPSNIQYNIL